MAVEYDVRMVPVGELKPFKTNARTHPARQIAQISEAIGRFGFTNPILIDEDNEIIAGHGRLLAAKARQMTDVPTLTVTGLSPAEKRALRLSDNRIALSSGWDREVLQIELGAIQLETPELLELTGFDVGEIDVLMAQGGEGDVADEVVPAVPVNPVTRRGDIWLAGPHRIGCGDAKEVAFVSDVVRTPAHAAFMDPPFNVKVQGHAGGKGRVRHREFHEASGEMTPAEFVEFLSVTIRSAVEVSTAGAVHFLCMDHHHLDQLFEAANPLYDARLNLCVWNKSNAGMGSLFRSQHELIAVYRVAGARHRNNVELGKHGRNRTNVWNWASVNTFGGSRAQDLKLHPTVKPTGLVAEAIKDVTKRGETVLDLFLGSGTTLLAAERVGRVFAGTEIDPGYVDVALTRWTEMTGHEPVLEATGQTFSKVGVERIKEAA